MKKRIWGGLCALLLIMVVFSCTRHALLYEEDPIWLTKALILAEEEIKELPGDYQHHIWIIEALKYSGVSGLFLKDETSWCAAAMNYILKDCGIVGTGSAQAASFLKWGHSVSPRKGGIAVFLSSGYYHVTIMLEEKTYELNSGPHYKCIGGNQSDAYQEGWQRASDLVDVRWPGKGDKMREQAKTWLEGAANVAGISSVVDVDDKDPNTLLLPLPRMSIDVLPSVVRRKPQRFRCDEKGDVVFQTHEVKLETRNTIRVAESDAGRLDDLTSKFIAAFPKYKDTPGGYPVLIEPSKVDYGGFQYRMVDVLTQRETVIWVSFRFGIYEIVQRNPLKDIGVDVGINGGFNVS